MRVLARSAHRIRPARMRSRMRDEAECANRVAQPQALVDEDPQDPFDGLDEGQGARGIELQVRGERSDRCDRCPHGQREAPKGRLPVHGGLALDEGPGGEPGAIERDQAEEVPAAADVVIQGRRINLKDLRNGLHRDLLGRKSASGFNDLVTVDPRRAPFGGRGLLRLPFPRR